MIVAVDDEARIRSVIPELRSVVVEGLITLQEAEVP